MKNEMDRYQAIEQFKAYSGWWTGVVDTACFMGREIEETDDLAQAEVLAATLNAKGARLTNHVVMAYRLSTQGVAVFADGGLSKAQAEAKVAEALADPDIYSAQIRRGERTVSEKTIRKW